MHELVTEAKRVPWRMQAGSTASATLIVADADGPVDISGWTATLTPQDGDPIPGAVSDGSEGTRTFSWTAEHTEAVELARIGRWSVVADGDEVLVGPVWASRSGGAVQSHELTLTLGAGVLQVTVLGGSASGGSGVPAGGTGVPAGGTDGSVLARTVDDDEVGTEWLPPNSPGGYLRLDEAGTAPDNRIPSTIARDTEVTAAVDAHANLTTSAHGGVVAAAAVAAPSGVASLDGAGKVPNSQLPGVALTTPTVVADQAAMLALTAETGDVAIRTDVSKSFILAAEPASTLGNWLELLTPPFPVVSVNGETGAVTLAAGDVGAAPAASSKGFVAHGANAATARPSGHASVEWFGTVFPANWVDGDSLTDPTGELS